MANPGQPNSIPKQVPGKFTPLPDPNGGGNIDFFRNVSNWAGDVGRAAKGATVQTTKWGQRNLSATGLANIGNDIGHAEQRGRGAFGAAASRNLSGQGISHIYHDALGFKNEASKVANGIGAYFGTPNYLGPLDIPISLAEGFGVKPLAAINNIRSSESNALQPLTGDTGSKLNANDTIRNFSHGLGSKLHDAVNGFFNGKTYTDVGSAGGGYISNVVNAAQKSVSDINLAIKAQVFEDPNAIKQLQQQQLQEQPGLGADPLAAPLKAIGKPIADTTAHMAGAATTAAFDNLQHMYRAAELAYQRDGVQGVLDVLSPAIIGAAVGSLVGNPEIGLGASGVTDLAGATIGSVPTDVVGSAAARTALEAGTTADNQTIGITAAKAAEEAAAKTAGPTVAEEQAMARAITASKIVRHGASIITKPVGGIMKGLGEATSSPANIGGQLGMQAWYLPGSPEHDIWMKSRVATGDLSTFGRAVSKQLGFGENSVVSGVLDGLIFLQEGPFTTGRAAAQSNGTVLGKLVSGHSVTVVDRTSVETAYRTNPGTRRTIDNMVKRGQTPLSKKEIAKGINPVTKLTGEIVRLHRELEGIAPYLAEVACKPGATSWDVVQEIGGLAEAESYKSIQVPTTGLYGMLKRAKLSDGNVSSFFSRNLGQSPMSYDDSVRSITKLTLNLADKNFGNKLGALLQQTGMKSSHISYLIGSVVRSGDRVAIDNTIKQALKENFYQRIDRRILSNLPKEYRNAIQQEMETGTLSPESIAMLESHLNTKGFESAYHALRNSISDRVDQLVNSAPGADGIYSRESTTGNPDSTVGMADGPRQAALYENQMGEIVLPDYRTFDKELRRFFDKLSNNVDPKKSVEKSTSQSFDDFIGNTVIDGTYGTTHIDEWVNERFFKPLALLTPGWALRVSLSELALNTFRLGPGNMLAGRQTAGMIKTNTKMFGRAQEFAKVHLKNLEEDIAHDQSLVDAAKEAGDGIKERGYQQQVNQKQAHLDWLKSPAGTEKPTNISNDIGISKKDLQKRDGSPSALNPPERLFTTDIQKHLADKGYKIPMTAAENLAMIARGVAVGLDQAIITAFGKDEFIKNAAYLMWRHGGYLAPAVDSRHNIALSMVDMSAFETVGKRKFLKKPLQDAEGKPVLDDKGNVVKEAPFKYNKKTEQMKTKQVFYKGKPVWGQANLFANGYFEGWQYMASTMMGSTYLGRPLAGTYLDLVNKGMQGQALHDAAVSEARKLIEAMPENVRGIMARKENVALGDNPNDPYLSWASKLVNNLEAVASREQHAIRTAEETIRSEKPPVIRYAVNKPLLRDIADGNLVPDINSFRKKYSILNEDGNLDQTAMPLKVTSRLPQAIGGSQFVNQLSAYGHGKVLGPMVNYLSRQPTYIAEFMAERKLLESRVKEGILNADQADVIAETNATQNMVRYIHNPDDKTKFEEMMRIASPFYFAQNQAWRRMGRLFADNPGAFMQYAATMYGVQQVAQQYKDKTGMATVLIPGLSLWGVPFMGSTSSLQTMDPFAQQLDPTGALNPLQTIREMVGPHMGPVVSIPLEAFVALIPALKENKVTGTAIDTTLGPIASQQTWGQNLYQALIPNSILRNLVVGIRGFASSNNGSDFTLNSYNNAKLEAFIYTATEMSRTEWNRLSKIKYSNDATDDKFLRSKAFAEWNSKTFGAAANSWQQQQFLDAANKKAGLIWAAKLALGLISPIAISTGAAEQKLRDQFKNYIADKKYKGNYAAAISAYERDHPYATLETISKSKSVSGARIPINQEAGDFIRSNADTINRYPLAAWAYGPDLSKDPTFSEPTNMAMMASGIRERLTPDDFYKSFLVATGNAYYYGHIKPYYELYKESSGAYAWKQQKMDSYGGTFNKVWRDNYKSQAAVSTKDQAYTQIKEMVQQPQYKNLPVTALYKELIRQVEQDLKPAIIEAQNGSYTFQEVKDAWEQRMDDFRKKHPEAGPGIDAVFYNQG